MRSDRRATFQLALLGFLGFVLFLGAFLLTTGQRRMQEARQAATIMRSLVTLKTKAGYFQLEIWSDPSPPPVAQLHTWTLRLLDGAGQPVEGAKVTVDAIMPAHGHGMPTQPQVKPLGRGLYQVEGMKFSMEGEWQVLVRIETQGVQDQAAFSLKVR